MSTMGDIISTLEDIMSTPGYIIINVGKVIWSYPSTLIIVTPYNVGSVLRRITIGTAEAYHRYCRGCSVLRGVCISTAGGLHQYCGGIASVLRRDSISTAEG